MPFIFLIYERTQHSWVIIQKYFLVCEMYILLIEEYHQNKDFNPLKNEGLKGNILC